MPGLHALQNAQPKHQIPNEAPKYFNPFFEQPAKPPPVTVWQPPQVEGSLRSKAPNLRPRAPPTIPVAGVWTKKPDPEAEKKKEEQKIGLFQAKPKKSMDEIMWLGAVTGFEVKEEPSMRTKLARKPEEIPSQASAATGPKATEAQRKKEEEEKARERRLAEWASKKKPQADKKKQADGGASGPAAFLPQPIESRLRPRKKVYTPIASPSAERPGPVHRPHLPTYNSDTFAPVNTILPQPIETTSRSTRQAKKAENDEGQLWMGGSVQPYETTRRSNKAKKSRLNEVSGVDDAPDAYPETKKTTTASSEILPQPIETSVRSSRRQGPAKVSANAQSSETTASASTRNRASQENLPEPIETTRKSNRPQKIALPKPFESSLRSNRAISGKPEGSSSLAPGATKPSSRPDPVPIQGTSPPTPTTSFFGPDILPQPIETTRRSYRPLARPLVPQVAEPSVRTKHVRPQEPELHLELPPRTIPVSRWNSASRLRGNRRESTSQPMSPGLYAPPLRHNRAQRTTPKDPHPPVDHVWHLDEPVDSAPSSPLSSPDRSRPPSLSSSPTSSAATTAPREVPAHGAKKRGGLAKKQLDLSSSDHSNPDVNISNYMLGLRQSLEKADALGTAGRLRERAKEEPEYPFPITASSTDSGIMMEMDTNTEKKKDTNSHGMWCPRSTSSETVRPSVRTVNTSSLATPPASTNGSATDTQPVEICKSPVFSAFKRPTPDDLDILPMDLDYPAHPTGLPTPPNSIPKPTVAPLPTAPARLHYSVGPSPGYTVASRPPTKRKSSCVEEVTPEFVDMVYRYLSLQYENVGCLFDEELAEYTGMAVEEVSRGGRKEAVKAYCERWVEENPQMITGERSKQGFW